MMQNYLKRGKEFKWFLPKKLVLLNNKIDEKDDDLRWSKLKSWAKHHLSQQSFSSRPRYYFQLHNFFSILEI